MKTKASPVRPRYQDVYPDASLILDLAEVSAWVKKRDAARDLMIADPAAIGDLQARLARGAAGGWTADDAVVDRLLDYADRDSAWRAVRAISGGPFEPAVSSGIGGFLAGRFSTAVLAQSVMPAVFGFSEPPPVGQT